MIPQIRKLAIVLGANGFLGQNLCYWLVQHKFSVIAVGKEESFDGSQKFDHTWLSYLQVDLSSNEEVSKIPFATATVIYMMAGQTGTSHGFTHYQQYIESNEISLLNVLSNYKTQGANSRIIFPSTRLVYKGQKGKLLSEGELKETKTIYAVNKLACEQYLSAWSNAFQMPYTIFRICIPYGQLIPGNYSYGTLGFMLQQARENKIINLYGDGSSARTFSHVADICEIFGNGALDRSNVNYTLNIGSQDHLTLKELAEIIAVKYEASIQYTAWPELDKAIESGDTMFDDTALQEIYPYAYKHKLAAYINEL